MSRGFSFGESRTLECPLLAQSGHWLVHCTCPLLGVKRTSPQCRPPARSMNFFEQKNSLPSVRERGLMRSDYRIFMRGGLRFPYASQEQLLGSSRLTIED